MELKDFVSETIVQIATGIKESMKKCESLDAIVNPDITFGEKNDFYIPKKDATNMQRRVQIIEMDISVIVSNSSENSIGGKINIPIINIGGNTKGIDNTTNTNRIKFSIPVALPVTNVKCENRGKADLNTMNNL